MRVDGKIVGRAKVLQPILGHRLSGVAGGAGYFIFHDLGCAHVVEELGLFGQSFPFRPCGLEFLRSRDRGPLIFRNDGEEVAVANNFDDAGDVANRVLVDAFEVAPIAGGRTTRPCSMPGTLKSCM